MTHEEMILKAKEAKSAEELLAMAKETGMNLDEEGAKAYFEQLHKSGELSDDELGNVSGGGCHSTDGRLVVTIHHKCDNWVCARCGGSKTKSVMLYLEHYCKENDSNGWKAICNTCRYCVYENGLWLCNHIENIG